ncbi:MAG: hypothetical protein ABL890_02775 [Candidatus Peribacteraceae bacterium]
MKKHILVISTALGALAGIVFLILALQFEGQLPSSLQSLFSFISWIPLYEANLASQNCGPQGCGIGILVMFTMHMVIVYTIYGFVIGLFLHLRNKKKAKLQS